jgi:low affinity Fe/Cu permease
MKNIYYRLEKGFEKLVSFAITILGNSITFIIALLMVIFWISHKQFWKQGLFESIRDTMHAVIFLTLFIIQKAFGRFAASLHLKVNELVSSHEPASNLVIDTEEKTEHELNELSKEYIELAKEIIKEEEK